MTQARILRDESLQTARKRRKLIVFSEDEIEGETPVKAHAGKLGVVLGGGVFAGIQATRFVHPLANLAVSVGTGLAAAYFGSGGSSKKRTVAVLSPDEARGLTFLDGPFEEDVLYVQHPYAEGAYLKAASFHDELQREKRNELKELLHCWGATKIAFKREESDVRSGKVRAKASTKVQSAEVNAGFAEGSLSGEYMEEVYDGSLH